MGNYTVRCDGDCDVIAEQVGRKLAECLVAGHELFTGHETQMTGL